jgi:hypothetical protein
MGTSRSPTNPAVDSSLLFFLHKSRGPEHGYTSGAAPRPVFTLCKDRRVTNDSRSVAVIPAALNFAVELELSPPDTGNSFWPRV